MRFRSSIMRSGMCSPKSAPRSLRARTDHVPRHNLDQFPGLNGSRFGTAGDKQAVCNQPQRSDVDQASALVDQVDESLVDIRIFARTIVVALRPVDDELRSAILQPDGLAVAGLNGDGPLLPFAAPPVEGRGQGTVGDRARESDI